MGTAQDGSTLEIVGMINKISLSLLDGYGRTSHFTPYLVIVKRLFCGLYISLPFLVENGLDRGCPKFLPGGPHVGR